MDEPVKCPRCSTETDVELPELDEGTNQSVYVCEPCNWKFCAGVPHERIE